MPRPVRFGVTLPQSFTQANAPQPPFTPTSQVVKPACFPKTTVWDYPAGFKRVSEGHDPCRHQRGILTQRVAHHEVGHDAKLGQQRV